MTGQILTGGAGSHELPVVSWAPASLAWVMDSPGVGLGCNTEVTAPGPWMENSAPWRVVEEQKAVLAVELG